MGKDAFYFSHDSNARNDEKMLQLRAVYKSEGYGWYWIIIEMMRDANAYKLHYDSKYFFKAIAEELKCSEEKTEEFIEDCIKEFNLFVVKDGYIYSESLLRRMAPMDSKREKARASATIRWEKERELMRSHKNRNANKSKVNESKVDIKPPPSLEDVISYFKENGYDSLAAKRAFNYYTELEWKDANDKPVKSWKSKMQAVWFKPENKDKSIPEPRKMVI
jgi:hypothetical protein